MKQDLSREAGAASMWLSIFAGTVSGSVLNAAFPSVGVLHSSLFRQGMGTDMQASGVGIMMLELCCIPLFCLVCAAVLGTSLAGKPLGFGMLFLRGMALGTVLCELYLARGASGFLTALLFVMPFAAAGMFLFMLAAREMGRFSSALLRCVLGNGGDIPELRLYMLRFLVLAGFLLLTGGLQCIWLKYGFSLMTGK